MKKLFVIFTLTLSTILLASCQEEVTPELQRASNTFLYFDSSVSVSIYIPEDTESETLEDIFEGVDERLKTIHELSTRYDDVDDTVNIRTINENPGIMHEVDPLLYEQIEMAIDYHALTNGYFDITLGPVLDLWSERMETCNEGGECVLPDDDALQKANESVGIDKITMNDDTHEVSIEEGMSLDLGGIAKGFGADKVTEYLKTFDVIDSFLVNAGTSNIEVYGTHPTRESGLWNIALTDPERPNETAGLGAVQIESGTSVVTSGDYVRYYTVDDERYHHIIDPNTLYPADHYRSVSLIVENGTIGDILVTAAFLMEPEVSEAFIDDLDDVEALWVMPDGSRAMTDGFEDYVFEWRD